MCRLLNVIKDKRKRKEDKLYILYGGILDYSIISNCSRMTIPSFNYLRVLTVFRTSSNLGTNRERNPVRSDEVFLSIREDFTGTVLI